MTQSTCCIASRLHHPLDYQQSLTVKGEGNVSTTMCLDASSLSSWTLPTRSLAEVRVVVDTGGGKVPAVPVPGCCARSSVTSTSIRPPANKIQVGSQKALNELRGEMIKGWADAGPLLSLFPSCRASPTLSPHGGLPEGQLDGGREPPLDLVLELGPKRVVTLSNQLNASSISLRAESQTYG